MSYVSLLVHLQDSVQSEARVQLASLLASRLGAKLIGVAGATIRSPVVDPSGFVSTDAETVARELSLLEPSLNHAEARFRRVASLMGDSLEWRGYLGSPSDGVIYHSALADLVVVGQGHHSADALDSTLDPADVVMGSGRPVLIVPPMISRLEANHVVVAWSNTREARRAVADALPLLQLASRVSVVEVAEESMFDAASVRVSQVADFLRLHDVEARGLALESIEGRVSEQIIYYAQHKHADLIVAGGYGHPRLREWAFGGVTRDLLSHCPKCCLISH